MKKKGFTLIELLAVIVLIAIVTLISIPLISDVIEKAQKGALKASVQGIAEAANYYYQINMQDAENNRLLEFSNGKQIDDYEKLSYKGSIEHGMVLITTDNKSAICIDNGKWYAKKELNQKEATIGDGICDGITVDGIISVTNKCVEDINACNEEIITGKEKIANAIKSRGYEINENKSFEELATGIKSISSGPMFKVNTVTIPNDIVKFRYDYKTATAEYFTMYIDIKKLNSDAYDTFLVGTDTAKITYSNGGCWNSPFPVFRFSPTVIGVMYYYLNDASDLITDYRYYLKTFKWNASTNAWELVTTTDINPVMYRDSSTTAGASTVYYCNFYELPFQDVNNHYAYFDTMLTGFNTSANGYTTTNYLLPGYMSINKTTGAVTYSISSSSTILSDSWNYDTGTGSTSVYGLTTDGYVLNTYTNANQEELKSSTYYSYVTSASGGVSAKSVKVTAGEYEYPKDDLYLYGYVSHSGQRYWVRPSISLDTSSKKITTIIQYKEISTWGYDDLSFNEKNSSNTFNISSALPDGKSFAGRMNQTNDPSRLAPGYYFLDYTTGDLYAIFELNSGYLYVTGKLVENNQGDFYKKLSLNVTGVRYSDTVYDGSSPTSSVKLNKRYEHYTLDKEYVLSIK